MPYYAIYRHNLHWLGTHHLTKALCGISVGLLKDFTSKGRKSAKWHKLGIYPIY